MVTEYNSRGLKQIVAVGASLAALTLGLSGCAGTSNYIHPCKNDPNPAECYYRQAWGGGNGNGQDSKGNGSSKGNGGGEGNAGGGHGSAGGGR